MWSCIPLNSYRTCTAVKQYIRHRCVTYLTHLASLLPSFLSPPGPSGTCLQELNISGSLVEFPFPPLLFAEPEGEEISARHSRPPELLAAVSENWRWGEEGGGIFECPKFARSLKKLSANKTSLWMRWDLSTFPLLKVLEVSYASRALLPLLRRKVGLVFHRTSVYECI